MKKKSQKGKKKQGVKKCEFGDIAGLQTFSSKKEKKSGEKIE